MLIKKLFRYLIICNGTLKWSVMVLRWIPQSTSLARILRSFPTKYGEKRNIKVV